MKKIFIVLCLLVLLFYVFIFFEAWNKDQDSKPTTTTTNTVVMELGILPNILGLLPINANAGVCSQRVEIPLADGSILKYNAYSADMYTIDQFGIRNKMVFGCNTYECKDAYLVVMLCPEGVESFVHAGMILNYCLDDQGKYVQDIYLHDINEGTKWFNYTPTINITGKPALLSIAAYRLVSPLPSNV